MPNEPTEITILSYFDGKITGDVEAFWLWHGAETMVMQQLKMTIFVQ
jgi:hypothetical protein